MTGQQEEMVLVPRNPTPEMIYAAKDCALAEDAAAVWIAMIEEFERLTEHREFRDG